MEDILDLALAAVAAATRAGAEWADAVCLTSRHVSVSVEKSSIKECQVVRDGGIGVRAFIKGGMGAANTQSMELADVRCCGEQAADLARAAHPDPDFVALPQPAPLPEVSDLFDEYIAGLPAAEVVRWCHNGIQEAQQVAAEVAVSGGASLAEGQYALASSSGIAVRRRGTSVGMSLFAVVRDGDEVGSYFEYDVARRQDDFEPQGIGQKATQEALRFLGAKPVKTQRMPVILGPLSASGLLFSPIDAANAESIQRGRSFMMGKCGQQVASELVTIEEDPFVPAGLSSTPWDGEGVPKQKRVLIDRGVLTTYLHNSYTAAKAGVENTAHAVRSGYQGNVGIGPTNLLIHPGARPEKALIAEMDEALYINAAELSPDSVTGDISASVDFGFKIENGEIAYPINNAMIAGHIADVLGRIDAISSDYRAEPGMIMPSIRITDMQVAGSG